MVVHRLSDMSQKTVPNCGDRHLAGMGEPARWRRLPLSGVRQGDARNARALPQPRALIHAIVHVQNELRSSSSYALAMRHLVEGPSQLSMLGDEFPDLVQTLARGFQALFEFGLGFHLGLAQRHLYAAMGVHFAFAGGFDR